MVNVFAAPENNYLRKRYIITAALSKLLRADECGKSFRMLKCFRTEVPKTVSALFSDKPDEPCLW